MLVNSQLLVLYLMLLKQDVFILRKVAGILQIACFFVGFCYTHITE